VVGMVDGGEWVDLRASCRGVVIMGWKYGGRKDELICGQIDDDREWSFVSIVDAVVL